MKAAAIKPLWATSIGKKIVMSLTGLFLITFLISHMTGNLQLLYNDGGVKFNEYAEFMAHNPVIKAAEIGTFAGFILHIIFGIMLTLQNDAARPVKYKVSGGKHNSTFFSRSMKWSALFVLIFLIIHLAHFFVPHKIIGHSGDETLYDLAVMRFSNPAYCVFYIVAMILLSFHLSHGFQSAFQSLGLQVNKPLHRALSKLGLLLAVVICSGFAAVPVYFLIRG